MGQNTLWSMFLLADFEKFRTMKVSLLISAAHGAKYAYVLVDLQEYKLVLMVQS